MSTNPEFECEVIDPNTGKTKVNLVRPCERYKELYQLCKSIKNRLYQYYIYGETLDCSPHRNNHEACLSYRNTGNLDLLDPIIAWENQYITSRKMTVSQNKTWQLRQSPPDDFDKPLPAHIEKNHQKSIFRRHEK